MYKMIDNLSILYMLFLGKILRLKYLLILWDLVYDFVLGDVKYKCNF